MLKKVLIFCAILEILTGLILLISPSLMGQLLLGIAFSGVVLIVARIAGIALLALGFSCWPGSTLKGILIYNLLITVYLAYIGFVGDVKGVLLWPVVILHLILTVLLLKAYWYASCKPVVSQ